LANQEFHQAARKLKELCTALSETEPSAQDSGPSAASADIVWMKGMWHCLRDEALICS
jgi:hypothetical protein